MKKRTIGVYAGSFDPVHYGHIHVIKQAIHMFDTVYVVVAHNTQKKCLFSVEDRVKLIQASCDFMHPGDIVIAHTDQLLVKFVYDRHLEDEAVLIRGVRPGMDFDHEYMMADFNYDLSEGTLNTILIPTSKETQFHSSSAIKEIMRGDPSGFMASRYVTTEVKAWLVDKYKGIRHA